MRHFKDPDFRPLYEALPPHVRRAADKSFSIPRRDPKHPSLRFKRIREDLWSARVGRDYRALALEGVDGFHWFWIGSHADYDAIIRRGA
jgi:hypothetical protein